MLDGSVVEVEVSLGTKSSDVVVGAGSTDVALVRNRRIIHVVLGVDSQYTAGKRVPE